MALTEKYTRATRNVTRDLCLLRIPVISYREKIFRNVNVVVWHIRLPSASKKCACLSSSFFMRSRIHNILRDGLIHCFA